MSRRLFLTTLAIFLVLLVSGCTGQVLSGEEPIQEDITVFRLTGGNFYFEMDGVRAPEVVVNKGDRVKIEFTSVEGFHDWTLDEFGASTQRVRPEDGVTSVEFVADHEGTFDYYCSVGSHRQQGMFGSFVVK